MLPFDSSIPRVEAAAPRTVLSHVSTCAQRDSTGRAGYAAGASAATLAVPVRRAGLRASGYSTVRRNIRNPPLHPPRQNESPIHIKQLAALTESTYARRASGSEPAGYQLGTLNARQRSPRWTACSAHAKAKRSVHVSPSGDPAHRAWTGPRGSFVAPRIGAYLPHKPSPGTPRRGVGSTAPESLLKNYSRESRITIA